MLNVLLESAAPRPRHAAWTVASTAAHAALIAAAVLVTLSAHLPSIDQTVERVVLALPQRLTATPATPRASGAPVLTPPTLNNILVVIPDPPAIGVSNDLSPILGPSDTVGPGLLRDAFQRTPVDGRIYDQTLVERAVVPRADNPRPEYPASLRAAGVEGSVLVQFVVDSVGRVEPRSISVLQPAHPLFVESARRWLVRTRYLPARIGARPVRQLVQQEIAFTLVR